MRRIFGLAALVLFLACGESLAAEPLGTRSLAAAAGRVTQIIAHRGASAEAPENTLAGIRRAIEVGATAVEVDVRTTQDGQLVLSHDPTLDRMTTGSGPIAERTLAEVRQLDAGSKFAPAFAGERVPTLAEALEACRGKIDVLLDLKEEGEAYLHKVLAAVRAHGEPKRTILGVRSAAQARDFRRLLPEARQLGLIAVPDDIEPYAAAGVEMIRLWPRWLAANGSAPPGNRAAPGAALVARVRQAGAKLHLNGTTGTADDVLPLLAHEPDSLSSDDPRQLVATLRRLAGVRLRVLSYNIHHAEGVDGRLDLPRIAGIIKASEADVVALQEVDQRTRRSRGTAQADELARLTGLQAVFGHNIDFEGGQYGNAVLSCLPIVRHKNYHLPRLDAGEQRGVLEVELELPGGQKLLLLATHLDHRRPDGERLASAQAINDLARGHGARPMLLAGDLNATPDSAVLQRFEHEWLRANREILATIPVAQPARQIDYVLLRPASRWKVVEVRVLAEAVASDHRPILATLELVPPAADGK